MSRENVLPKDEKLNPQLVEEVLGQVLAPEQAEQVLKAIIAKGAEAKVKERLQYAQLCAANLAIAAHQNSSPETPSMLDVISWERFTRDTSYEYLIAYSKLDDADKAALPGSVLHFAAGYTVYRDLFAGEDIDEAGRQLKNTGYSVEEVHKSFVEAIVSLSKDSESPITEEQVLSRIPDADSLSHMGWPNEVFDMWEANMRKDLQAAGYKLPELTEDGSYGLEEGTTGEYPSDFLSPEPDESMIPST